MQAPLQARNDSEAAQTDIVRTQKRVLADNRPEAVAQRQLAEMMNNSPRVLQQRALSDAIDSSLRMVAQRHAMHAFSGGAVKPQGDGAMPAEASPAQREEKTNNTGLPNQLKSGIESLSGMSMDHVKVHYNSDKPAQLQAHAYAQGNEIHLGAGQERHLPHEAWHVVQQAQGRVRPNLQMKACAVNDDPSLESEADRMGEKAAQFNGSQVARNLAPEESTEGGLTQRVAGFLPKDSAPVQRKISVPGARVNPVGWHEAYLALIYPKVRKAVVSSRAVEDAIINQLKHLDNIDAKFDSVDELLMTLRKKTPLDSWEQDDVNEQYSSESDGDSKSDASSMPASAASAKAAESEEQEVEDEWEGESDLGLDQEAEQKAMGGSASSIAKLVDDVQIFGEPVSAESRGEYFALYRSVEKGELKGLADTIKETGIPEFKFKEGKAEGSHAEKMFAPNKAYVVESMGDKGKRSCLMEILVKNEALQKLIYNPEFATVQGETGAMLPTKALDKGKKDKPSAITLKQENPKGKKGITYTSVNIGFRKSGNALGLLAKYIVSIKLLADRGYDPKNPDDKKIRA